MALINDERVVARQAPVREARREDAPALSAALAAAFFDDRVFRWFSPDDARRRAMLPAFMDVFVDAYLAHGEVYTDDDGAGAALWAHPGIDPLDADPVYAERLGEVAGVDAPRLFEIVEIFEAHAPKRPHLHLQLLAVRPEQQGGGIGGRLMAPVLARADREGVPAYLEATGARNRALYERHGFRSHGPIALPDGPALWAMWREPIA